MKISGANIVIKSLRSLGVDSTIYPGGAILPIYMKFSANKIDIS